MIEIIGILVATLITLFGYICIRRRKLSALYEIIWKKSSSSTLAEVEDKDANCKLAIKAYVEALKVFRKEEFPEIYPLVEQNLRRCLNFCRGE